MGEKLAGDDGFVRDFSRWPEAKIGRAQALLLELQARVLAWSAASGPSGDFIRIDDHTYEVRLHVATVPLAEWGAIFGDILHNARSALDAMVWELCTVGRHSPRTPSQVRFPVLDDKNKWADKNGPATHLKSMGAAYLDRILQVQPFNAPNLTQAHKNLLWVLHDFNNTDKHRGLLEATAIAGNFETRFSYPVPEGFTEPDLVFDMLNKALPPLVEGEVFMHVTSSLGFPTDFNARLRIQPVIGVTSEDKFLEIGALGQALITNTLHVIRFVRTGVMAEVVEVPPSPTDTSQ